MTRDWAKERGANTVRGVRATWLSVMRKVPFHNRRGSCLSVLYGQLLSTSAVFQTEIACLVKLTDFRQDRWGHDRVQEEFNHRLIRSRKLLSASLRFIHNDLIGRRHIADYTDQHISKKTAERCLRHATRMIEAITSVLETS